MGIILKPFALLLLFFYNISGYGVALILFAIVIKMILFPVTLKGKKSMIQMNMLSGKMQQLQKQYGKDRDRYNLEVQKLYEKEKVNPMGGCLWSFIPVIVLIALYAIIREPMTYFMSLSMDQIQQIAESLDWQTVAVANGWVSEKTMADLAAKVASGELKSVFQNGSYNQMYLASMVDASNLPALQAALGESGLFAMDFTFLGINLSVIPNWKLWETKLDWNAIGLFILPLISVVASYLSMKVSMATNRMNNNQAQNEQMDKTNRMMMWMMPVMSLWIGFTLPAGLCVYWIAQYVVTMIQEYICGKMLKKDYEAARLAAEERERQEKEEEKQRKEEARLERARRIEEEKKNRGKKKPVQKKKDDEPAQDGVNKDDSREGIRAYARGRAYIPGRFGAVTPYTDPNELLRAQQEAQAAGKGKKKKAAAEENKTAESAAPIQEKEEPQAEVQEQAVPAPGQEEAPMTPPPAGTEEVEVEVEEIEVEAPENEEKEV